jgi:hypothetical protein
MLFPKFNVSDCTRCGFFVQCFDIEDIPEKHRVIFEDMLTNGHTVRIVDDVYIYTIR